MIRFEFVVSEGDAENIMCLFQSDINRINERIMAEMCSGRSDSEEVIQAYKAQIVYMRDLKDKIKTHWVEDEQ